MLIELIEPIATILHLVFLLLLYCLALAYLDLVYNIVNLTNGDTVTLTMPDLIMLLTAEGLLKN